MRRFPATVVFIVMSFSAWAQPQSWQDANQQSAAFIRAGNYDKAAEMAELAVDLYSGAENARPRSLAQLSINLADTQLNRGRYQLAERALRDAFDLIEDLDGDRLQAEAMLWKARATVAEYDGDFDDSRRYRQRHLSIIGELFGQDSEIYVRALMDMANELKQIDGYRPTKRRLDRARSIVQEHFAPTESIAIELAINLAKLDLETRNFDEAEEQYEVILDRLKELDGNTATVEIVILGQMIALYNRTDRPGHIDTAMFRIIELAKQQEDMDPVAILKISPESIRAFLGETGEVLVEYGVDVEGRLTDLKIVDSTAPRRFENAVIEAMEKWRYIPMIRDGEPVATIGFRQTYSLLVEERIPTGSRLSK